MRVIGATVLGMIVAVTALEAQRQAPPPPNPLSLVAAFRCTFPKHAATEWPVGEAETTLGSEAAFSFRITNIDLRRGRARIAGTGGTVDVTAMLGEAGLNVIEQTGIGNFILTTVFRAGGQDRVFIAAHSRHLGDLQTVPSASQHFGTCEPLEAEAPRAPGR